MFPHCMLMGLFFNHSEKSHDQKTCFSKECACLDVDRVSVPWPIASDIPMVRSGEGQSSHVPIFCVNLEQHVSTHIIRIVKCYIHSLRYICAVH